jgi:hypothetical protein
MAAFFEEVEVTKVKKYLVMKIVAGLDKAADLMTLPGIYTLDAAEEMMERLSAKEPDATYMIQEVGAA